MRVQMAVPEGRIFLINSMGELHNINHTYRQTYLSLSRQVDLTFPPLPHDGADDAFDGHDTEDDDEPNAHEVDGPTLDHDGNHSHRGLMDASNSDNGNSGGGSGGSGIFSGLPESTSTSSSSSSSSSVTAAAGGSGGGGGASAVGGSQEAYGKVSALVDDNGDGSTGGRSSGSTTVRPLVAKTSSVSSVGAGGAGGGAIAKSTVPIPRRWAEVAPRREVSFYPNRAAVEDRFTDLNFWRDPPPLIGDDDDEDDLDGDDDDDDDESQEEDEGQDAGQAKAAAAAVPPKGGLAGSGVSVVGGRGGKLDR